MEKNWYQKMKDYAANAPKFEKCAYKTCNNEVLAIGKKYCGRKDCPKIEDDKAKSKKWYLLKYKFSNKIKDKK